MIDSSSMFHQKKISSKNGIYDNDDDVSEAQSSTRLVQEDQEGDGYGTFGEDQLVMYV